MITKKELTKAIADRANITHKEAMRIFDVVQEIFYEALESQEDVKLFDGVIFTIKDSAPRTARNPRTGETISVPAKKKASVRFGKTVKDILANMK
jgi:nucleoid DNA-binding protein